MAKGMLNNAGETNALLMCSSSAWCAINQQMQLKALCHAFYLPKSDLNQCISVLSVKCQMLSDARCKFHQKVLSAAQPKVKPQPVRF